MKRYKAISDTEFVRIVDIQYTPEEVEAFVNGTKEERLALMTDLEERFADVALEGSELAELETVYNAYKPVLKDGDVYELISFDVALENGVEGAKMGAYNYKLNNKICNVILR